jgi:hypothetical protein
MPLHKGKSQKTFVKNLKTELEAGKPMKQSLAISYAMKRKGKGKKMAEGGGVDSAQDSMRKAFHFQEGGRARVTDSYEDAQNAAPSGRQEFQDDYRKINKYPGSEAAQPTPKPTATPDDDADHKAHGGFIGEEKASGYADHEGNTQRPNGPAHSEDAKRLNQRPVDMQASTSSYEQGYTDALMNRKSQDFSSQDRYAMGGDVAGTVGKVPYEDDEQSLVDRIMYKRSKDFSDLDRYSKGGQVANDVGTGQEADKLPNQHDDLVLRDELESSYGDDNNSGDASGNSQEDEDRKDIVARIMASRRKKDRLPNPA